MRLRLALAAAAAALPLALASVPAPVQAQPAASAADAAAKGEVTVYRGATLIDGTGAPARADVAIVVEGARIAAVQAAGAAVPAGAKIVDARGLYVLPGLIDTHVHLATPPNRKRAEAVMRRQVYAGITAVRDMADDLRAIGELTRASLVGELAGPDIYYAALMAGPSFFTDPRTIAVAQGAVPGKVPWMQAISDETDLPIAVAMARGTSATGIKIYANLPGSLVGRITREAHRQGVPVWSHGMVFPALPAEIVDAGVDVVSHVCYLAYQVSDVRPGSYQDRVPVDLKPFAAGDNPVMADLFGRMKRKNIILDATNRIYVEEEKRVKAGRPGDPPRCPSDLSVRLTRQAFAQGVMIASGTDGMTPWDDPYPALHEELDILAKRVGMPNLEVIRAATETAARTIGKEAEMGTVAPGKLANLLFLARDPSADIANLRSVRFTVKRGRVYDRGDYRPVTAEEFGVEAEGKKADAK
ncbi:amidohydrolase family protein [Sphingosinicella rhizophila]|uniref:Amidohydrolase family protein n=1 Tax=Sphingosinicella rhizophila TaxID=3050082 RepID=A0ABU3Q8S1_9SPHN|nr:amidohydrolase family protein [Sphingosinicella sp. GR2756]MDT9599810.1 amidohydrolase family protein [Sphingosinicella sp. GR2756]